MVLEGLVKGLHRFRKDLLRGLDESFVRALARLFVSSSLSEGFVRGSSFRV